MAARKRLKVLVIDDDPIVLEVVRERLVDAGHTVTVREEALGTNRAVRDLSPDVIVLDIMMPAINGERIIELLRRDRATAETPVIVHSSKAADELGDIASEPGVLGCIPKTGSDLEFMNTFDRLVVAL